ncbi:MAG: hypothetical protein A2044_04845 [Candidatus Firestonebacteria bacterium GWA2_43_8]|nr:MAG: hypothetical protein A2044_04845 [Candidatus Firestonebacteria bacterium GWA2_43_8]
MMNGQDKWMRVSGAWLLGDMEGDEKAAEILMGKINDKDYHFKRRVLKSLAKLVDPDNKKHLSPETDAKVSALVHETACKEQWVI